MRDLPSSGPPWILGARGSPLEAPENTLAGLARALELGLDGVAYDLRCCRSGELVLLRDATLERTTDGQGPVAERTWRELAELDAGSWFGARFRGQGLALLEEALALTAGPGREAPQHVLRLSGPIDLAQVRARVGELAPLASVRVASARIDDCLEARALGLVPMLVCTELGRAQRELLGRERLPACAAPIAAWRAAGMEAFECERWSLSADDPGELLWAARAPLHGLVTREPLRALALRDLARLAPSASELPLVVPRLALEPALVAGGSWWGSWKPRARVTNPFGWPVRVALGVLPRRGAFELRGVPAATELAPGEFRELDFELTGGAWQPGGDPLLWASLRWRAGPGRAAGRLLLDVPLERVRSVTADEQPVRLELVREGPELEPGSMLLRRQRGSLLVSVEHAAGLSDVRTLVLLEGTLSSGARGLRARLPSDFDQRAQGLAFSCGFSGERGGRRELRRWSGGLPLEEDSGAPGRLYSRAVTRSGG